MKCYRFVTNELKSQNGDVQWKIGEWVKHEGELNLCKSGLHACKKPLDSLSYVYGDRWFQAEARGEILHGDDKFCASEMRIMKEIPLIVIQRFAIDCAEHVLHIYEKQYPNDSRVRDCIKATRKFLDDPSDENRVKMDAAWSAAESAAWSAAESAGSAAWSAGSAAGSAAESAEKKWQRAHLKQLIKEALK